MENKLDNEASDLEFSNDGVSSMDNQYDIDGIGDFRMRDDFSADMSDRLYDNSVDFSDDAVDYSMYQNGDLESFDSNDMSDYSSDFMSNGYDMYRNGYYSDEYSNGYSGSYDNSLYSSDDGSYSEAQFSEDVHERIAAQRRAEQADWEDFAEHNRYANVDSVSEDENEEDDG